MFYYFFSIGGDGDLSNTITLPSKFFFQMSLNHEFVSTGFLNFKLIFWQLTKMIICRYSEEVWSVLVGSIVWYWVSRDNQLYAELCSPRGCSIVSNYYHKLRKLVGGDSFRELELGKWVTITITFLKIFFHLPETCLDKPTPSFRGWKLTLTCVTKTTGKSSPFSLVETICVITVTTR